MVLGEGVLKLGVALTDSPHSTSHEIVEKSCSNSSVFEALPAGQNEQLVAPVFVLKVPALHKKQLAELSVSAYVPAAQRWQSADPSPEK